MSSHHIWNFSTVGGVKRVNLESGSDLLALRELDQKLWTALSCPVEGLEIDSKTLQLIDLDSDGRIRVPEILTAVEWICTHINNADELLLHHNALPLAAINQSNEEGKKLFSSAKQILKNLGFENANEISIAQTGDLDKIFAGTKFNGDGIITSESTEDADLKKLIQQILKHTPSQKDRNGKKGINKECIETFYTQCQNYFDWHLELEKNKEQILAFGNDTEAALSVYLELKSKVDDYFLRLKIKAYDGDSSATLNPLAKHLDTISLKNISENLSEISAYPISKITESNFLNLEDGVNPAWQEQVISFKKNITNKILQQKNKLTLEDWNLISEKLSPYINWKASKKGESVEEIGFELIKKFLLENRKEELMNLIAEDLKLESEANSIILVDKLVRYYCDIFRLLQNFVTFNDFYSPNEIAIFQNGVLFIDQRSCDLCIKVSDMDKHNSMVSLSGMYLMYCDCVSKSTNQKMTIVVAMTNGDIDNLMVGRNAVFYDRNGHDWDATIIKIIDNPISIRQAFFSPYRKVAKFIESQVEKFAQAKEKEGLDKATAGVEKTATQVAEPPKAPPTPFDIGKFVGIFAAISLALGAIGGILASFISGFLGLIWWQMPLALIGLTLAISGPSMIIAWLKLRKRNLAPILDANGWAINARAIINIPFGNTLTHLVKLPLNAKINLNDPFKQKKNPIWKVLLVLALITIIVILIWRLMYYTI